jgi:hypothetical protein
VIRKLGREPVVEDWERVGHEFFAPLREILPDSSEEAQVAEKSLERVKDAIGAADLAELATTVFVGEFLGPVLDIFAFALGFEDEDPASTGSR